ncbi:hypothetical protein SLEP1_g57102 [Rubroshorea leprosula]|uniref:Uncharacterized protein n=1 Tax=Rubroshorea leprosula TaxID=152421 RepID=A0AAV5MNS1_9ROSI|nr:hypothetical protein SLEP1_g57102 [Rubroshorea leprosula]
MASWLQARPELSCHKDELKQLSSFKVVGLGKGDHEDELKQLSLSEVVYLIQMGCHEDELKQLSSSEAVEFIRGCLHHPREFTLEWVVIRMSSVHLGLGCHEDELKHRLSSFEVVYLIRGSSLRNGEGQKPDTDSSGRMQEKCRHLVEGVDTLQLVLHIFQFMLVLCTSCSSSALHARPLQLVADLGTPKILPEFCIVLVSSATRAFELSSSQLMFLQFASHAPAIPSSCCSRDFTARYCQISTG